VPVVAGWCDHDALTTAPGRRPEDASAVNLEEVDHDRFAARVHPEMYARVRRQTDGELAPDRYVEQVERPPLSVRISNLGRRLRGINLWLLDALVASTILLVAIPTLWAVNESSSYTYSDPGAIAILLTIAVGLPFYFRRHAPVATLVAATIPTLILCGLDYQSNAASQALLIATYTAGAYAAARYRVFVIAWVIGALLVARAVAPDLDNGGLALNFTLFTAAYLFGTTVQNRRLYTQELEERAVVLERERDEEAKRAVADERLHIAQELHDVVAHSMGVIAVQAGVGAHVIDSDPAEAKKSLEAISLTSRTTLTEIRRMLGVLRSDGEVEYAPAASLDDVDRLVDDVRGAGLDVDVRAEGDRAVIPPGVEFTAYRIVQEALTNVLKHAGKASASVVLHYEPTVLRIEVIDNGRGINGNAGNGGHGLMGMRERVGVYGGTFEAGPRTGGGFRVMATLPFGAPE
jgi:signal transduction histidine kinase